VSGVGLYFQDIIRERIRADWDNSWELRSHLNASAIQMAHDHVVLGVGLNNYTVNYPAYNPDFAAKLIEMENMLTAVHNLYLLVWAEVGTVGLLAFLTFLVGSLLAAWRALPSLDACGKSIMIGFICGLLGAMANDITEFALWVELCMYTIPLLIGMLPALRERTSAVALRGGGA
jgi:putative inorganic carbon (hco3(-)) transporter